MHYYYLKIFRYSNIKYYYNILDANNYFTQYFVCTNKCNQIVKYIESIVHNVKNAQYPYNIIFSKLFFSAIRFPRLYIQHFLFCSQYFLHYFYFQ